MGALPSTAYMNRSNPATRKANACSLKTQCAQPTAPVIIIVTVSFLKSGERMRMRTARSVLPSAGCMALPPPPPAWWACCCSRWRRWACGRGAAGSRCGFEDCRCNQLVSKETPHSHPPRWTHRFLGFWSQGLWQQQQGVEGAAGHRAQRAQRGGQRGHHGAHWRANEYGHAAGEDTVE